MNSRTWGWIACAALAATGVTACVSAPETAEVAKADVPHVIFDTDMVEDFDDVGALAILHALADAGECEILATVTCTRSNRSAPTVETINRYYGRPDIPIGAVKNVGYTGGADHRKFEKLMEAFPAWHTYGTSDEYPDAVEVYRKVLAAQPDGSVTVCSVGFLTNLALLLKTGPDVHSPLNGRDLVAKKVKRWVAMACSYPDGREYNSMNDWKASEYVLENWPTPAVFSDFQYGRWVYAGRRIAERGEPGNPVRWIFNLALQPRKDVNEGSWDQMAGHPSWDETAVLAAVRGTEGLFGREYGTYRMRGDQGDNRWIPAEGGESYRLTETLSKAKIGEIIDELMCRPPRLGAASSAPARLPDWAFGPFERPAGVNPVVKPDAASVFDCPMQKRPIKWEESDTFNPAAAVCDGKICVLYRAEDKTHMGVGARTSRLGFAETEDGCTLKRSPAPVLFPGGDDQEEFDCPGGCEDPRLAVTEDGLYVLTYTSWNRKLPRLCIATSRDLRHWKKHGPAFAKHDGGKGLDIASKSAAIVQAPSAADPSRYVITKVNGKYVMYWGEATLNLATSDNLVDWTPGETVIAPRRGLFDSDLTEMGPAAIMTDKGIVVLYNGKNAGDPAKADPRYPRGTYCGGQILCDRAAPGTVLDRLSTPYFRPEADFEKTGQYADGTVFTEGLVFHKGRWHLYYGCADSFVGYAVWTPAK